MISKERNNTIYEKSKIMLVGDDMSATLHYALSLEEHDSYTVLVATSALECLQHSPSLQPDVIILNDVKKEVSSIFMCEVFARDPKTKDIPIVVISRNANDRAAATRSGAFAVLYDIDSDSDLNAALQNLSIELQEILSAACKHTPSLSVAH